MQELKFIIAVVLIVLVGFIIGHFILAEAMLP